MSGLRLSRIVLEAKRARKPALWTLALLVLGLASTAYIAANLRMSPPWKNDYWARVALEDAKGVVAGGKQQVRVSGLTVGAIEDIEIIGGRPVATIKIASDAGPIYRDARLRLRPKTPLEDLFLDIEDRGHRSAGKIGWEEMGVVGLAFGSPPAGDPILAQDRTVTPVSIGRIFNVFDADTRERLETATDELGRGLGDDGYQLRATLTELAPFLRAAQRISRESAIRRVQTQRLVHNFRLMTEELARRDRALTTLVRGGDSTFTELADREAALADVITDLAPTMRRLKSTFTTVRVTADELDPALDELQPVARALPAGMEALRQFSVDADPALESIREPLPELEELVSELEPTSQGLDRAFTRLRPSTPRLDRITALVVPCEPAVSKFFHNTLSLLKISDARGIVARGQTIDGNDSDTYAEKSCAPGKPRKGKGGPSDLAQLKDDLSDSDLKRLRDLLNDLRLPPPDPPKVP